MNYSRQLVAFLDILGFSEICLRSEKSDEDRIKLSGVFNLCASIPKEFDSLSGKSKIKSMVVSDSIILTLATEGESPSLNELANFFLAAGHFQYHLCRNDFWLRGGISFGSLNLDLENKQVVGPALIRAIQLEKNSAKYPRIVVDPQIMNNIGLTTASEFRNEVNAIYASNKQRALFEWESYFQENGAIKISQDVPFFIDFARSVRDGAFVEMAESIARGLRGPINHYEKYRWLADYLLATGANVNLWMNPNYQMIKTLLS